MKNKIFITLFIIIIIFGGYYFYQTNFSKKAKLEGCADINLVAMQMLDQILDDIDYRKPLKDKLRYPEYEKNWDECENEFKNSPIKFNEKYKKYK